jgi:hypothetical protein
MRRLINAILGMIAGLGLMAAGTHMHMWWWETHQSGGTSIWRNWAGHVLWLGAGVALFAYSFTRFKVAREQWRNRETDASTPVVRRTEAELQRDRSQRTARAAVIAALFTVPWTLIALPLVSLAERGGPLIGSIAMLLVTFLAYFINSWIVLRWWDHQRTLKVVLGISVAQCFLVLMFSSGS